jgi:ABC-type glycerol-3-phosphate transport system permease component
MPERLRTAAAHGALLLVSAFCLVPIAWMYLTALRPREDVLGQSPLPSGLSLGNVREAAADLPLLTLVVNTTAMSAGVAVGQLLVALLAAYAFSRWSFRGERLLFLLFVLTWLVPFQVTMIPNYVLLSDLEWLGSLTGVVVPQLTTAFAVMLLRQHLRSFPRDLLDAARMDGRGSWSTLWTVVVPNLRAPLAALGILLFVNAWNEYFWPLLVLRGPDSVAQIALKGFLTDAGNDYGALMAASGILCLPVFALYLVLQRHVIDAFVRSGLR